MPMKCLNYKFMLRFVLVTTFSLSFFSSAFAKDPRQISEQELFQRCYFKLSQSIIPNESLFEKNLIEKIKLNQLTGAEACSEVLKLTTLNAQNRAVGISNESTKKLTLSVLKNLHNFHITMFQIRNFQVIDPGLDNASMLLKDIDEPALFYSRALFGNKDLQSIFEDNVSLKSIREHNLASQNNYLSKIFNPMFVAFHPDEMKIPYGPARTTGTITPPSSLTISDDDLVSWGPIVGIKETRSLIIPQVIFGPNTNGAIATDTAHFAAAKMNVDFFQNLGGGILGSQVYLLKNSNLNVNGIQSGNIDTKFSEFTTIARSLTARIFDDFMCHELPTLTEEDVLKEVVPESPHAYHQSASCMVCHSSIDPLANTFRNISKVITANTNDFNDDFKKQGSLAYTVIKVPPLAGSKLFPLQTAQGRLKYRSHENKLIENNIVGIQQLANHLKVSPDFYRCTAKKYYKFFTGIDVQLTPRNISAGQDNQVSQFHRNFVYSLAEHLQTTQSLTKMIEEIFSSETFKSRDFKVMGVLNE